MKRYFYQMGGFAALLSLVVGTWLVVAEREIDCAGGAEVVVGGDLHFGESYSQTSRVLRDDARRYQDSLAHLRAITMCGAFALVNLETPLSLPRQHELDGKEYIHWSEPEKTLSMLKKLGIDAVGLANNHLLDQGAGGLDETTSRLSVSGIASFGAGADVSSARAPLIQTIVRPGGKPLTLAVFAMLEERSSYRKQFRFYAERDWPGVSSFNLRAFRDAVRQLRQQYSDLYVIAYPHWGKNYAWASNEQVKLARRLVDAGADIVLGHGAHNLQEIERYQSKWILYGIGNFLFQTPGRYARHPKTQPYSLVVEMSFGPEIGSEPTIRLRPFLSDNRQSHYQPQPVSTRRAETILEAMRARSKSIDLRGEVIEDEGQQGAAIELSQK